MKNFKTRKFKNKRNENVVIRSADVQDAKQILQLAKSVVAEDIYQLITLPELNITVASEKKWIVFHRDHSDRLLIVAEVNGEIVGLLNFANGSRIRTSHTGEFGMSIAKAYRRLGIGKQMLQALIEWAESHPSIEKINLEVHSANLSARSLYETVGFVVEGIKKNEIRYSKDRYVDAILMGRFV